MDVVLTTGTAVVFVTETWVDVVLTTGTAVVLVTETWVDVVLTTGTAVHQRDTFDSVPVSKDLCDAFSPPVE